MGSEAKMRSRKRRRWGRSGLTCALTSRASAGGKRLAGTATSSHECGGAIGRRSQPDDAVGELELSALLRGGGDRDRRAGGSPAGQAAVVSEGGSVAGGEISSTEGGGTEEARDRAMPRWRTAPQRAQGPPGGGTEIQAGAEPAEELPDRGVLQRDE